MVFPSSDSPSGIVQGSPVFRRSSLAIASLICGITSICCLGFLSGIPAVICGHMARSRMRKAPGVLTGGGMALAGIIMGYLSILLSLVVLPIFAAIAIPATQASVEKARAMQQCHEAKKLYEALIVASLDNAVPLPSDGGFHSVREVAERLMAGGYLPANGVIHLEQFEIGNVSANDPPETILVRSKPVSARSSVVVVLKDGATHVLKSTQSSTIGSLPPREPAFLP